MLGGQMSSQDEDEVEDELEALEQELSGSAKITLPDAPTVNLPSGKIPTANTAERAESRGKTREQVPLAA